MWWLLSLLSDLVLMAFGVFYLLLAYRRIGKPEGADPKYDAWLKQRSGLYKVLGWGWVVVMTFGLIGLLVGMLAKK
jgi:hypothetical protein